MAIFTISIHILFIIFLILSIRNDSDRFSIMAFILFLLCIFTGSLFPFTYKALKAENQVIATVDNKQYTFVFQNGEAKSHLFLYFPDMEIVKTKAYSLYGFSSTEKFQYQKIKQ